MAIGTSLGAYFPDEISFHMNSFVDQGDGVSSPTPNVKKDNNEVSPDSITDTKELRDPNKPITVSDTDSKPNLLQQAQEQYPVLKNYDYGYTENFKPNTGFLEHWNPNDPGIESKGPGDLNALRPKELPMDKPGLEIRDPATTPKDVLGDIVSHHLVDADPVVKDTYQKLQQSITPAQEDILKDQYDYAQKNEGETGKYEDWRQRAGMPGFLRGYAFDQWPKEFNDKAYTQDQKDSLDKMMDYLKGK